MTVSNKLATIWNLYLLDLFSQVVESAMPVCCVCNVVAEGVPHHPLPVILVYSISLAQSRECVAAVVRSMLLSRFCMRNSKRLELTVHVPPECYWCASEQVTSVISF